MKRIISGYVIKFIDTYELVSKTNIMDKTCTVRYKITGQQALTWVMRSTHRDLIITAKMDKTGKEIMAIHNELVPDGKLFKEVRYAFV